MKANPKTQKVSAMEKAMSVIEKVGNLLPHPFWLFAVLALITVVCSFLLSLVNWSASYETVVDGAVTQTTVSVVNLLTFDTLGYYLENYI